MHITKTTITVSWPRPFTHFLYHFLAVWSISIQDVGLAQEEAAAEQAAVVLENYNTIPGARHSYAPCVLLVNIHVHVDIKKSVLSYPGLHVLCIEHAVA